MKIFKEYLKENGGEFYSRILAVKIVDKLEVFTTREVPKEELIKIVTKEIKEHLSLNN